jgi:glycosyltransferase involved in cell wall biosynthesis
MEIIGSKDLLKNFRARYGRPPKILHIGNIANNAYLNAKYLNHAGYDCDVLCYDYYHIMACPEWEELVINTNISDPNFPQWHQVSHSEFFRPRWFAQGKLDTCLDYLIAKREGDGNKSENLWIQLSRENNTLPNVNESFSDLSFYILKLLRVPKYLFKLAKKIIRRLYLIKKNISKGTELNETELNETELSWFKYWEKIYEKIRFNNDDFLRPSDIIRYHYMLPKFKRLFENYDLIHAYSTDGILSLLAEKPYLSYEHGTIRSIPFQDTQAGRLCRLTYKMANFVCITNADNIVAAKKLNLLKYGFLPHPINEDAFDFALPRSELVSAMHKKYGAEYLIFHPSRQHWGDKDPGNWDKGNDVFIEGLAKFVKENEISTKAILVEWGQHVNKTKQLIKQLNIKENIIWIAPISAKKMAEYIQSVDLLADQFYLGAFGSTLPRALACGTPAMIFLNEKLHEWCFREMPPVINARNQEEVNAGLIKAFRDRDWVAENSKNSMEWYKKYHSSEVIVATLNEAYKNCLEGSLDSPTKYNLPI